MTKKNQNLTSAEINELLDSYARYKKAEDDFKRLRDIKCKKLEPGVYRNESGYIVKGLSTRQVVDYKKMVNDLNIDTDDYTTVKDVETITMHNLRVADEA